MADDAVLGLNSQPFIEGLQRAAAALAQFESSTGRQSTSGGGAASAEAEKLLGVLRDVERAWERVGKLQRGAVELAPTNTRLTQQNLPRGSVGEAVGSEAKAAIDQLQNIGASAVTRLGAELGTKVREITSQLTRTVAQQAIQEARTQGDAIRDVIAIRKTRDQPVTAAAATQQGGVIGPQPTVLSYARAAERGINAGRMAKADPTSTASLQGVVTQQRQQLQHEVAVSRAAEDRAVAERAAATMTQEQNRQLQTLHQRRTALMEEQTRLEALRVPTGKIFENGKVVRGAPLARELGVELTPQRRPNRAEIDQSAARGQLQQALDARRASAGNQVSGADREIRAFERGILEAARAANVFTDTFQRVTRGVGFNTERGRFERAGSREPITDDVERSELQRLRLRQQFTLTNPRLSELQGRVASGASDVRPIAGGGRDQVYDSRLERVVNARTGVVEGLSRTESVLQAESERLLGAQRKLGAELAGEANARVAAQARSGDQRYRAVEGKPDVYLDTQLQRAVNVRAGSLLSAAQTEQVLGTESGRLRTAQERLGTAMAAEANARVAESARGGNARYRAISGAPDVFEDTRLKRAVNVRTNTLMSAAQTEAALTGESTRLRTAQERLGVEMAVDANARVAERARGGDARYTPITNQPDVFLDRQLERAVNVRTNSLLTQAQTEKALGTESSALKAAQERLGAEMAQDANARVAERARGGDARYQPVTGVSDVFNDTQLGRAINVRTNTLYTQAQTEAALSGETARLLAAEERLGAAMAADANAHVAAAAAAGNARYTPIAGQPDVYLDNQLGRAINTRTNTLMTQAQTERALGTETNQLKAAQRKLGAEMATDANRAVAERARAGSARYRPIAGQVDLFEDKQLGRAVNVRTGTVLSAAQSENALRGEQQRLGAAMAAEATARLAAAAAAEQGARFLFGSANLIERGPGQVSDVRSGRQLSDRQGEVALEQERRREDAAATRATSSATRAQSERTRLTREANADLLRQNGAVVESHASYARLTDAVDATQRTFRVTHAGARAEELLPGDPRLATATQALDRAGVRNSTAQLLQSTRDRVGTASVRPIQGQDDLVHDAELGRAVNLRTERIFSLAQTEGVLDAEQKRLGAALATEANAHLRARADAGHDARYLAGSRNVVEDARSGQLVNVATERLLSAREREIALSAESSRVRGRVNDVEQAHAAALQESTARQIQAALVDPSTLRPGVSLDSAGPYHRFTDNATGDYAVTRMRPGGRSAEDLLAGDPRLSSALAALDKARTQDATDAQLASTRSRQGTPSVRPITGGTPDLVNDLDLGRAVNLRTNTILSLEQTEKALKGESQRLQAAEAKRTSELLAERARSGQDARFLQGAPNRVEDLRSGRVRDISSDRDLSPEASSAALLAERQRVEQGLIRSLRARGETEERANAAALEFLRHGSEVNAPAQRAAARSAVRTATNAIDASGAANANAITARGAANAALPPLASAGGVPQNEVDRLLAAAASAEAEAAARQQVAANAIIHAAEALQHAAQASATATQRAQLREQVVTAGRFQRVTDLNTGVKSTYRLNAQGDRAAQIQPNTPAMEQADRALQAAARADNERAKAAELLAAVERKEAQRLSSTLVAQNGRYYQLTNQGTRASELQGFGAYNARQSDPSQRSIGANFVAGLTSRGFGGSGGGKGFDIGGLAQSAGTTVKYSAMYDALNQVQGAATAAAASLLNYEDSIAGLNLAFKGGETATQPFINQLQDIAAGTGQNVGDVMDQASIAMRAFGGSTNASNGDLKQFATQFSSIASRQAFLTGQTTVQAGNNVRAGASSLTGADDSLPAVTTSARQYGDAAAGAAKRFGADSDDVAEGFRTIASQATQAGLSAAEAANLVAVASTRLGESGQVAGTRLQRILSIIGGSEGQNAIRQLNDGLGKDQKIDLTASTRDQAEQLSAIYDTLDLKQKTFLTNRLGGTGGAGEFSALMNAGKEIFSGGDYAGEQLKEFERRMKSLSGYIFQLKGEVEALWTAFTQSGVIGPLKVVAFTLLEITKAVRVTLQSANALASGFGHIPDVVREIGASLLVVYGIMRLISSVRNGGVSARAGRAEALVNPERALARRTLAGMNTPTSPTPASTAGGGVVRTASAGEVARARADLATRQARVDALRATPLPANATREQREQAAARTSGAEARLAQSTAILSRVRGDASRTERAATARPSSTMRQGLRERQERANESFRQARDEQRAAQGRYNRLSPEGVAERTARAQRQVDTLRKQGVADSDPRMRAAMAQANQDGQRTARAQAQVDRLRKQGVADSDPRMRAAMTRLNQNTAVASAAARTEQATARMRATSEATTAANAAARANIRTSSPLAPFNRFLARALDPRNLRVAGGAALRGTGAALSAAGGAAAAGGRAYAGNVREAFNNSNRRIAAPALSGLTNATNGITQRLNAFNQRIQRGTLGASDADRAAAGRVSGAQQRLNAVRAQGVDPTNARAVAARGAALAAAQGDLTRAMVDQRRVTEAGTERGRQADRAQAASRVATAQERVQQASARPLDPTNPAANANRARDIGRAQNELVRARLDQGALLREQSRQDATRTATPTAASRAAGRLTGAATATVQAPLRALTVGLRSVGQAAVTSGAFLSGLARGGFTTLRAAVTGTQGALASLSASVAGLGRAALASNAMTSLRSGLGNLAQELKSSVGGIFGVMIAVQLLSAAYAANKRYVESQKQSLEALRQDPETNSEADYRQLSETQKTAASDAKSASSGVMGTLVDIVRDGELSQTAKDLTAAAEANGRMADRAKALADNNAASDTPTLDFSSVENFTDSLQSLQDAGRGATTIMNAFSTSLDQLAAAASGHVSLTGQQTQTLLDQVPDVTGIAGDRAATDAKGRAGFWRKVWGWGGSIKQSDILRGMDKGQTTRLNEGVQDAYREVLDSGTDLSTKDGKTVLRKGIDSRLNSLFDELGLDSKTRSGYVDYVVDQLAKQGGDTQGKGGKKGLEDNVIAGRAVSDGIAAMQAGAQRAAADAANGIGKDKGTASELVEARTYLEGLKGLRAQLVASGANATALEGLDDAIASATSGMTTATINNMALTQALAHASIPSTDTVAQLDAQLGDLRKQYRNTTEAGARTQLQTQAIQVAQQRYVANQSAGQAQDLANQSIYDNVGQAEAKQRAADQNLKRIKNGYTLDVNGQNVAIAPDKKSEAEGQARIAAAQAKADTEAARRAKAASVRRATIDPRDAVANADEDVTTAQAELSALDGVAGADQQRADLQRALKEKQQAADRARADLTAAINSNAVFPGDELAAARVSMENASAALALEKQGTTAWWQAKTTLNQQQYAYAQAQVASRAQAQRLSIDLTNPVQTAKAQLEEARDALRTAQAQPGVTDEVLNPLKENVRNAEASSEQAAFSQRLQDAQFADSMSGTSHQAYLKYLHNEHDRLTQRLSVMKETDNGYRQTVEQLQQIDQAMQSASDSLNSQFNIGDIKVPTPFEVRRSIDKQLSGLGYDRGAYNSTSSSTQNVMINVNGADIAAVMKVIQGALSTSTAAGVNQIYAATARKVGS